MRGNGIAALPGVCRACAGEDGLWHRLDGRGGLRRAGRRRSIFICLGMAAPRLVVPRSGGCAVAARSRRALRSRFWSGRVRAARSRRTARPASLAIGRLSLRPCRWSRARQSVRRRIRRGAPEEHRSARRRRDRRASAALRRAQGGPPGWASRPVHRWRRLPPIPSRRPRLGRAAAADAAAVSRAVPRRAILTVAAPAGGAGAPMDPHAPGVRRGGCWGGPARDCRAAAQRIGRCTGLARSRAEPSLARPAARSIRATVRARRLPVAACVTVCRLRLRPRVVLRYDERPLNH